MKPEVEPTKTAVPLCPKCRGLGIECYADPEDRDYHLRACDCPTGIAKKREVEGARS
jgi:hydrogenase maturation factor HypF (carbamoyltransferase family)